MKKPIYMETTEIPMEKTVTEISMALVQAGATSISSKFENGKIKGLEWGMMVGNHEIRFTMPARVDPVYQLLCSRRSSFLDPATLNRLMKQAERVAWRQLLRWVQAQLAMIDVGMVQAHEVFMPYAKGPDGRTMFEHFDSTQRRLSAPETKL